jgi:hypothetical protein
MRIGLVTSLVSPLRPAEANGPHAVVLDLARGLGARGHRVTIYAADGSVAPGCDVVQIPVDAAAAAASVRIGRAAPETAIRALDQGFGRLFARLRADAPDVVSQHAFDAAAFDLSTGLPVLHTLHLPPDEDLVLPAVRRSGGRLASVSRHARDAWRAAAGREIGLLRNGVPARTPATGTTAPVALIAGRIAPEKGTDAAVRVARRAGLAVLVAGDGYDAAYHAAAVEPLLRPGEWIGPVPRDELFELMARCAVLLMPIAWDEPFGLVAAEAQMAGCPVVAYRRGAMPEVVSEGVSGYLVEPGDEDGLVRAVHRARGLDREAIRARARAELSVEAMIDDYERELAAVASRPSLAAS